MSHGPVLWFAGGGTGGHLYPGLAIARAVARLAPGVRPHFIGAWRGIERDVLPGTEFPHTLLDLHPLYRRTPWDNWRTLRGALRAWRTLSAEVRAAGKPVGVVGTGGYAAGVALGWARAHGVPTMLHEPDSHPGLTTRVFAGGARAIYLGFPEAAGRLPARVAGRCAALGCPIDPPPLERPDARAARRRWGLPEDAFVLLVVGGSQGARALNETVRAWIAEGLPEGVALIWATGTRQVEGYRGCEGPRVRVRPYLSPIAEAYAAADLAITRAGAMTIAELCAWEIPAILVPLPTAAQDHQAHNARATAHAGAAIHLPQAELSPARVRELVVALQADPARRRAMGAAAGARGQPGAAEAIARSVLSTVGIS